MNETKKLSEFVAKLEYSMLPEEVIDTAKKAFLDCFGVTLAGLNTTVGEKIINYVKEMGGNPQATALGTKFKTSLPYAALANGVMAHALDYDDIIPNMPGHPSCTIVPVLLVLGEHLGISGEDLITAYVAGFEVGTRINLCIMDEHYKNGWHNTATVGSIAAMATAANLLNLNVAEIQKSFGIISSMVSGLKRNFGTMTKPLHAGTAARNGLEAAILAKNGFTARENILEERGGFLEVYCGREKCNLKNIVNILNLNFLDSYTIINPGIGFKKYPSCYGTHQAIDAMFFLMKEHCLALEQINHVKCETSELFYSILPYERPKTGLEGKFSFQYCLARVLLDRRLGLAEFTDEKVRESSVQKLINKVKVGIHPELRGKKNIGFGFTVVTVQLKNGKVFSKKVITPSGEPTNPISQDELVSKFIECASYGIQREIEDLDYVAEQLKNLEELKDIKKIIDIVAKGSRF